MFDPYMTGVLAALRRQEMLEEAARARLVREGQLATRMEAQRLKRARRRKALSLAAAGAPAHHAVLGGLRSTLARALRALAEWLEGPPANLGEADLSVAR